MTLCWNDVEGGRYQAAFFICAAGITTVQLTYAYKIDYVNYTRWISVEKLDLSTPPLIKAERTFLLGGMS